MSRTENEACPYCHIGKLIAGNAIYIRLHGEAVVLSPHMPALTCDICGYREMDGVALQQVERLLDAAGPIVPRHQPGRKLQQAVDKPDTRTTRRAKH